MSEAYRKLYEILVSDKTFRSSIAQLLDYNFEDASECRTLIVGIISSKGKLRITLKNIDTAPGPFLLSWTHPRQQHSADGSRTYA